jgi:hypothetical protein
MMRIVPIVSLWVLVSAAATPANAGACAEPRLAPHIFTPAGTTLDQDGGVVVGLADGDNADRPMDLAKPSWRFHAGTERAAPQVTILVPGLAIYAPHAPAKPLSLEDDQQKTLVTLGFEVASYDDKPIGEAPKVTSATFKATTSRRGSTEQTTVAVEQAPKDTVAVIAYSAETKDQARSWARVAAGATSFVIFQRAPCRPSLPGTIASRKGDQIRLVWVDAKGHTSQRSAPVTVK